MQTNLPGPGPVRPTEKGESGGRNTCVDYIVHAKAHKIVLTHT